MFQAANLLLAKLKAVRLRVSQVLQLDSEILDGAGAASVAVPVTFMINAGAVAVTLANGAYEGQVKILIQKTYTGATTITPASLTNGNTLTTSAAGESCELIWHDGGWHIISNNGMAVA